MQKNDDGMYCYTHFFLLLSFTIVLLQIESSENRFESTAVSYSAISKTIHIFVTVRIVTKIMYYVERFCLNNIKELLRDIRGSLIT